MPSPGTTSEGKCAESWNWAVSAASTMSHKSGISEWRQAGPLIALITGTSMSRSFINRWRPSQWMRSTRSIEGGAGEQREGRAGGEGGGAGGRPRAGNPGAGAGEDHHPVLAVGADSIERV